MKNDYSFKIDGGLSMIHELENSRTCDNMDIVMDYIEEGLPENVGFIALNVSTDLNVSNDSVAYKDLSLSVNENNIPTFIVNVKNGKLDYLVSKDKFTDSQQTALTILSQLQQQLY